MCHGQAVEAFPNAALPLKDVGELASYYFGDEQASRKIAVLPDIYGCNPFYAGLCAHLAQDGAGVYLVDTFHEFGDLPEVTRDAAFARRHNIKDRAFLDQFEKFCADHDVAGVIGFCLGGLYIFDLARRGMKADLLGLYGFPQGMENSEKLPVPFDYLPSVTTPFAMLMGREDVPVGRENVDRLERFAPTSPAMSLKVYEGVGHGFLPMLDSEDAHERAVAEDALAHCVAVARG